MKTLIRIVTSFIDRFDKARSSGIGDKDDINGPLPAYAAAFGRSRLPEPGETAAIALDAPKSAVLLFNRVWGIEDDIPDGIRFGSGTAFEASQLVALAYLLQYGQHGDDSFFPPLKRSQLVEILERGKKERFRLDRRIDWSIEKTVTQVLDHILGDSPSAPGNLDSFTTAFSRQLAKHYQIELGIEATLCILRPLV
jgi:hypothetical protein